MAMSKNRKSSITVESSDFEEQLRQSFNHIATAYDIPRGELLSRALYLVCEEFHREFHGANSMQVIIESMKEFAQERGLTFKDELVQDTQGWIQRIRDRQEQAHRQRQHNRHAL